VKIIEQGLEIGCDEAGRGSWAGPIVAAACVLSDKQKNNLVKLGVKDSKKLSKALRQKLYNKIIVKCSWAIGFVDVESIDRLGLQRANILAMANAIEKLYLLNKNIKEINCDFVSNLEKYWPLNIKTNKHIKGESKYISIATASIIAKVWRDNFLISLAKTFPNYGFDKHFGYGTNFHKKNLIKYGTSQIYRKSFLPIKQLLK
jgi:ribonuclease HII